MKTMRLFTLLLSMCLFAGTSVMAQDKKDNKKKKAELVTFVVSMTCGNCKAKIERHIKWEKGLKDLTVNLDKKEVTIKYDPAKTDKETLKKAIEALDYTCEIKEDTETDK